MDRQLQEEGEQGLGTREPMLRCDLFTKGVAEKFDVRQGLACLQESICGLVLIGAPCAACAACVVIPLLWPIASQSRQALSCGRWVPAKHSSKPLDLASQ